MSRSSHSSPGIVCYEDAHTVRFFPEIESSLIPVLGDVVEIVEDDGPNR